MIDILKELAWLIPEDTEDKAGWGPFTISDEASWMEPIFAQYHDLYYKIGPELGMRLSEIDVRVAKGLFIEATKPELDWMVQAHRIKHICEYWPIMRSAGHYMYARHYKRKEA